MLLPWVLWLAATWPAAAATYRYEPLTEPLLNPERGLYAHAPLVSRTSFARFRPSGVSLVYAPIYLADERDRAISAERLAEISQAFNALRAAGLKGIVRVSYSNRIGMPDAALVQVEQHLTQLTPIFNRNRDVIAFFQAGFIGAWGEWHSSTNGLDSPDGQLQVMQLLLKHLPRDRFIQVRTPPQKWQIFAGTPLTAENAFSGTGVARVGHHNDCFLANETDMGTYPRGEVEVWKDRLAGDTRYVPMGGETCRVSEFANCENALRELERFHWTYLNRDYHRGVIQALAPCWETIVKRLGYRLELVSCDLPDSVKAGEPFPFTVRLKNVGFAPLYNARPVFLRIIENQKVVEDIGIPRADPRRWLPGEVIELPGTGRVPPAVSARFVKIALWLPDAAAALRQRPEYSIRLANEGVWDELAGHNILAPAVPVAQIR